MKSELLNRLMKVDVEEERQPHSKKLRYRKKLKEKENREKFEKRKRLKKNENKKSLKEDETLIDQEESTYLGANAEKHFYLAREVDDAGEIAALRVVDEEGEEVKASEGPLDVAEFLLDTLDSLEITDLSYEVFKEVFVPAIEQDEQQEEPEEEPAEEPEEPEEEPEEEEPEEEPVESKKTSEEKVPTSQQGADPTSSASLKRTSHQEKDGRKQEKIPPQKGDDPNASAAMGKTSHQGKNKQEQIPPQKGDDLTGKAPRTKSQKLKGFKGGTKESVKEETSLRVLARGFESKEEAAKYSATKTGSKVIQDSEEGTWQVAVEEARQAEGRVPDIKFKKTEDLINALLEKHGLKEAETFKEEEVTMKEAKEGDSIKLTIPEDFECSESEICGVVTKVNEKEKKYTVEFSIGENKVVRDITFDLAEASCKKLVSKEPSK